MAERKGSLYIGNIDEIPDGAFSVTSSDQATPTEGQMFQVKNPKSEFYGDSSLADTWFGFGIVKSLLQAGRDVFMFFSKHDDPKLPGGEESNENW